MKTERHQSVEKTAPYFLKSECFVFEHKGIKTAYFPDRSLAFAVNENAANLLGKLKMGAAPRTFSSTERKFVQNLRRLNLLSRSSSSENKQKARQPKPLPFAPTALTLLLTTDCNLRCVYCYSEGGDRENRTIPREAIQKAIDIIVENAFKTKTDTVYLTIHGGGEPTCAWDALVAAVNDFQNKAQAAGLRHATDISTNGVLSNMQREWIVKNMQSIQVSLDGIEEIQNKQRPKADGSGSYADVMKTLRYFEEQKARFCIRSTVDAISPSAIESFVTELSRFSCCTSIHLEPLFFCGRCKTSGFAPPLAESFIKLYRAAVQKADEMRFRVWYSGVNAERYKTRYCGVCDPNFCLTPEGHVTACYEVSSLDDPRAAYFIYGRYDPNHHHFILNEAMIRELQKRDVKNIPFCSNCFCKYHCAADCAAKASSPEEINNDRCKINRELTMDQIVAPLMKALSETSDETF